MKFRDPFEYTFAHFEKDALEGLNGLKNVILPALKDAALR